MALQGVDTRLKALQPGTTLGDIAYSSATANTNTRLGIGSNGQYLTITGGVPAWGGISAGGMTLLSTTTLSGATVTLSSIDQSYVSLFLVMSGITNASSNGTNRVAFNGVTNLTNASGTYNNLGNLKTNTLLDLGDGTATLRTSANNIYGIKIDNYNSTTAFKTGQSYGFFQDFNTDNATFNYSFTFRSTTAITSIVISNAGGNLSTGTALLYGVK